MRRYYNSRQKYPYYFHPEIGTYSELCRLAKDEPNKNVLGLDNAEYECVLEPSEQEAWWCNTCNMVMNNTRFVLDNLDFLPTFRVNWNSYYADYTRLTIGNPRKIANIYNKSDVKPKHL